jgi:hypothetical protein
MRLVRRRSGGGFFVPGVLVAAADAGCIGEEASAAGAEKSRQTDPRPVSYGL